MKAKPRSAAILIENGKIALIERRLAYSPEDLVQTDESGDWVYYVFPGGHVEEDETIEAAVVREIYEELGLQVAVKRLAAQSSYRGQPHYYFVVERTGGVFGSGTGKELSRLPHSARGSVTPIWIPLNRLTKLTIFPPELVPLILEAVENGWPAEVIHFQETDE